MLRHALEGQGHTVVEARDQPEALAALRETAPDLVLTDLRLPGGDGFDVLRAARDLDPHLPVIVMTAYGSISDAVSAVKGGALDFLAKPIDPDHLLLLVARALAERRLVTENYLLKEQLASERGAPVIVGEDPRMKQVGQALQRAAATDATVLIEGESGTGKELFARALHALSPRAREPFVPINCAAIPEGLLETELFGHEKGAFTGAVGRKPGRFELAHGGTLFLDEIGDLPLALQPKILRAVEGQRFERVGGTASIKVDARVVAATNHNLQARVAEGRFRSDLFFRLSVFPVTVPPLRERSADIPLLARHFIERFCRDLKKPELRLSAAAGDALSAYPWPGNVRELQNAIERAVILTEGETIHRHHLNLSVAARERLAGDESYDVDLSGTLADAIGRGIAEIERRKIIAVLRAHATDRPEAARSLGITEQALASKLKALGLV
jgi:DNA-binding NtrC family response regulator